MAIILPGTPEYTEHFGDGAAAEPFTPRGPTYSTLVDGFLDPSVRAQFMKADVVNADQASDVRGAIRNVVYDLCVSPGYDPTKRVNFPSKLLPGVGQIIKSAPIVGSVANEGIQNIFTAVNSGDPAKVGLAVLGTGMAAVGIAVPVVGWIGTAITLLAAGIAAIFNSVKNKKDKANAEHRAELYRSFPPLQVGGAELDGATIQKVLRPMLTTSDWTPAWLPRFDGDWRGGAREGGYAFARGTPVAQPDEFGADIEVFEPSARGGLGIIPGTDQVTSVVQVSLVHDPSAPGHDAWTRFQRTGLSDPRGIGVDGVKGWTRVHDTGMYYPCTGRMGASLWEMCIASGSPYKYRLDVDELHDAWRSWAEGGLQFIRDVCYPWYANNVGNFTEGKGKNKKEYAINPNASLQGFFGTGIFYSIGVWACTVTGGTSTHPTYGVYPRPNGAAGPEMAQDGLYGKPHSSMSSGYSGAFLPILDSDRWPDQCMGERYHRGPKGVSIEDTLNYLAEIQLFDLTHTLVCASCSVNDVAFQKDTTLRDKLLAARATLLADQDRFFVDLADVLPDEPGVPGLPGQADGWRAQLVAAGVQSTPSKGKPQDKLAAYPPKNPGFAPGPANPWGELGGLQGPGGGGGGGGLLAAAGAFVALGAAWKWRQSRHRKNFVDQAPPSKRTALTASAKRRT